ncbi:MAG: hypothetical protein AAB920_01560 [Patescibacteria group bacterium]
MEEQRLRTGTKVKILENGKEIDEAVVNLIGIGGWPLAQQVVVESTKLKPGIQTKFAFIQQENLLAGWRLIFKDPMTNGDCFSQRAPTYDFEPI